MEKLELIQVTPVQLQNMLEQILDDKLDSLLNTSIEDETYLTRKEATKYLNIGLTKLGKLTKEGLIPHLKEGVSVFYLKSSLKEYRESLTRLRRGLS